MVAGTGELESRVHVVACAVGCGVCAVLSLMAAYLIVVSPFKLGGFELTGAPLL